MVDNPLKRCILKSPAITVGPKRSPVLLGLALLSILNCSRALALDPSRSVFQYNCQTWSRQNGLPANGVNAIIQTKDGYLWLGMAVGLVRFDGSEFKLLDMAHIPQLRSSIVTGLSGSRTGGLWFGLERSAYGFCDGKDLSFRGKDAWGGLAQNIHSVLEVGDGSLWIAAETRSGRVTRDGNYQTFPGINNADVTAECEGSQGRVWLL